MSTAYSGSSTLSAWEASQTGYSLSETTCSKGTWAMWAALGALGILLATTVSAPETDDPARAHLNPILPPAILTLGRMAGRLGALLLVIYFLYLRSRSGRFWHTGYLLLPILAFPGFGLLSVCWSPLTWVTIIQSVSFGTLILWAWLFGSTWRGEHDTSRALAVAIPLLGIAAIGLVILYFVRPDVGALTKGATGIFHSTSAGSMSSLGVFLTFSTTLLWDWKWIRWTWLFVPFFVACILLGGNRFSVIALILASGLVFCIATPKRHAAWTGIAGCVLAFLYFSLDPGLSMLDRVFEKIAEKASQGQSSQQLQDLSGRTEMWEVMWQSYMDSPAWGHGYFVTSATGEIYMWGNWGNWTAHSVLLQSLTTTGLLGTFLLLVGFAIIAWNLLSRKDLLVGSERRHLIFVVGLAVWFFIWGLINESFLGVLQPESLIFALFLGLAVGLCTATGKLAVAQKSTSDTPVRLVRVVDRSTT